MTGAELQSWLNARGHKLVVDGDVGPATRAAVMAAFTSRGQPMVTDKQIAEFARRLGCTSQQLRAIARVEASGSAFDRSGRPKMLYERHWFWRLTRGHYGRTNYSNSVAGGYSTDSWKKLLDAASHAVDDAFSSASWGKFQIMGLHWKDLRYPSPLEMAHSTVLGEVAHYEMFARFVEWRGLKNAVRRLSTDSADNRAFAYAYNGSNYAHLGYHLKLAAAMRA